MSNSAIVIDNGFIKRQFSFAKAQGFSGEIKLWERMLEAERELALERAIDWEGLSYGPVA